MIDERCRHLMIKDWCAICRAPKPAAVATLRRSRGRPTCVRNVAAVVTQIRFATLPLTDDVALFILNHGRLYARMRPQDEERFRDQYERLTGDEPSAVFLHDTYWGISLQVEVHGASERVRDQLERAGSPVDSTGRFNGNALIWKLIEQGLRVTAHETRYDAQDARRATQRDIRVRKNGGAQ